MKNENVELIKVTRFIGVNGRVRVVAVGYQKRDVVRQLEQQEGKPWSEIKSYYQVVKADLSYYLKTKNK